MNISILNTKEYKGGFAERKIKASNELEEIISIDKVPHFGYDNNFECWYTFSKRHKTEFNVRISCDGGAIYKFVTYGFGEDVETDTYNRIYEWFKISKDLNISHSESKS